VGPSGPSSLVTGPVRATGRARREDSGPTGVAAGGHPRDPVAFEDTG
jgi:hypothetical protein